MDYKDLVVLYGRGAKHLDPSIEGDDGITVEEFANKETYIALNRSVRDQHVVFIQSFGRVCSNKDLSPNDLLMECIISCDAINRAGAKSLTVIFPLMPYTRQDRKHRGGVPISARVVCDMLQAVHVKRFITFELHADQIQGFLSGAVFDHLSLLPYMCSQVGDLIYAIGDNDPGNMCMCATDAGAIYRTRRTGELLKVYQLAIISKLRDRHNSVASGQLVGDVKGKVCILVDDMVDTGGSLVKASDLLREHGASKIVVMATHGVLSRDAIDKLSLFDKVILTDTVTHCTSDLLRHKPNIDIVPLMPFLTDYLLPRINYKLPIGDLLEPSTWSGE
jgi:ribose-phosphate pyrophosphokinase